METPTICERKGHRYCESRDGMRLYCRRCGDVVELARVTDPFDSLPDPNMFQQISWTEGAYDGTSYLRTWESAHG